MRRIITILPFLCVLEYGICYIPKNEFIVGKFDDVAYSSLLPAVPGLTAEPQEKTGWLLGYQFATSEPVSGLMAMLGANALRYEEGDKSLMMLSAYASFRLWLGRFLFLHPYAEGSIKGPTLFYSAEEGGQFGYFQDYVALGCAIGSAQVLALSVRIYRYYENKDAIIYTTPYVFSASLCF